MASLAVVVQPLTPLQELQQAFCLFKLAGAVWVVDRCQIAALQNGSASGEISMYRQADGKLLMQRHLESLPVPSDPRRVVGDFMLSPHTTVYDAVAFSPLPTPAGTLNYWIGSPVQPRSGDWSDIKTYLLDVVCNSDRPLFDYLIRFLAHMLKSPEVKPGIMPVFLGGQGTGKGSFARLLQAIWSQTTLQVSEVGHVIGNFNAAIERKYAVFMDEALFSGDRKALDRLKSLVTEPTVTIEQKYQPRRTIKSYHRFFAASNQQHFAQIEADDRRFVFFQVSEKRKGDHSYWDTVHKAIDDPAVVAAMVHDLLGLDLSTFNVRSRPQTQSHMDQKLRSLGGFDRYWFEVLQTGGFHPGSPGSPINPWQGKRFVSTDTLLQGWKEYEKGIRYRAARLERDVHQALKRLCPPATPDRQVEHGVQKRGKQLPILPDARAEFAKAMGGTVEWAD